MLKFICFLIVVLLSVQPAYDQQISGPKKAAFIDHINNFLNKIVVSSTPDNGTAPSPAIQLPLIRPTTPPAINRQPSPIVVMPFENPAAAINNMQNSYVATNLMETIAPPAVRPCFIRPAFCPATSDACTTSRCARLYANGVRIGSRFYKRVKCRLNYCRETCGKAEWFADGRRLIGCSDSTSTLDDPIWSVPRLYPRPNRMDTRVLPIERVASSQAPGGDDDPTATTQPNQVTSFILSRTPVWSQSQPKPQRRSIPDFIGNIEGATEQAVQQTKEFGLRIKQKFDQIGAAIAAPVVPVINTTVEQVNSSLANLFSYGEQLLSSSNATIGNEVSNTTYNLTPVADTQDPAAMNGTSPSDVQTPKSSAVIISSLYLWPVVVLFLLLAL